MEVSKERIDFEKRIKIKDYPYSILLEPTAYCNLSCGMCMNSKMKRSKGYMQFEFFQKIVDQVVEYFPDSNFWMNGYGEPLLHKDICKMVKYAADKGIHVFMNTNAMLLDDKMADNLIESGIYEIVVSIDGFSKRTYESVRIGADRDIVYNNVTCLLQKINKINANKPIVEVQFIEIPSILHEKEEWISFWREKGARTKVKSYTTWGGNLERDYVNPKERLACGDCNILDILWDGRVPYCAGGDVECKYLLGDANKEPLNDIWQRQIKEFCNYHLTHQFDKLPPSCRECPDWFAMPAQHYDERGLQKK